MRVFVSWRGSDRDLKNKIVSALQATLDAEDEIWESDEKCESNFSAECIDAIRLSQVFVIIVSEAAMEPSYVIAELVEAKQREMCGELNMVVYKVSDVTYTSEFAANLNHISDANHVARLMGNETGVETLCKRVKNLLQRRKDNNPEKPYDVAKPEIEGISVERNSFFAEHSRDDVFEEFDRCFEKSNVLFTSQFYGYGKKSVARKYAEKHRAEYEKVLLLPFFAGSIREFFVNGLTITNINQDVFENLNEDKIILKKIELLSRLDEKTLLIVPDVKIDARDDRFIIDALCNIKCRIIFVTETVPKQFAAMFPVVSVGRMENGYLHDIFFYYYDNADEDEREEIFDSLEKFIDSIDGHTMSVEITARALADEYGIYPSEVPEILDKINADSDNELSVRITELISSLFDLKQFDDKQKTMLLVAALTAQIPLDEKTFVDMLKELEVFDSKLMKNLDECGWIKFDKESRSVCMEHFLARVCLSKIPKDEHVIEICLAFLQDFMVDQMMAINRSLFVNMAKRMEIFFEALGYEKLSEFFSLCILVHNDAEIDKIGVSASRILKDAEAETDSIENENIRNNVKIVFKMLYSMVSIYIQCMESDLKNEGGLVYEKVLYEDIADPELWKFLDELIQRIDEPAIEAILTSLMNAFMSRSVRRICTELLRAFDEFCYIKQEMDSESESLALFAIMLESLGYKTVLLTDKYPSLNLKICRAFADLIDENDGFSIGETEAYSYYALYFRRLIEQSVTGYELDEVFDVFLFWYKKVKKTAFTSKEEANCKLLDVVKCYCEAYAALPDGEKAEQAYSTIEAMQVQSEDEIRLKLEAVDVIVRAYITAGDVDRSVEFGQKALAKFNESFLRMAGERYADCCALYDEIKLLIKLMTDKEGAEQFKDASEEYISYYKTYAQTFADKRLLAKYTLAADAAVKLDYSDKSDEELLLISREMKKRAESGEDMWKIAPQAFALVSEAGKRTLGYKHHYVQYVGAAAIADGKIAEIYNGEGKTYTIILAAFLHSLYGRQVHITDKSKYLTERNFYWMEGVLKLLGCKVMLINENIGRYELSNAALCDVIYETLDAAVFNKMRIEMSTWSNRLRYDVLIADEADELMIAYGKQEFIMRTQGSGRNEKAILDSVYEYLLKHYDEKECYYSGDASSITLKPDAYEVIEAFAERLGAHYGEARAYNIAERMVNMGIRAVYVYERGIDYHVINGSIRTENKVDGTFRGMDELCSYFLSKKEGLMLPYEVIVYDEKADSCIAMEYLSGFGLLSGATATASGMKQEFKDLYGLEVISLPPNSPVVRFDHKAEFFATRKAKNDAILDLVAEKHEVGQPVLIIVPSIAECERFGRMLDWARIAHEQVNAKNSDDKADVLAQAGEIGKVTVATAIANRGVDIVLGGNPDMKAYNHLLAAGFSKMELDSAIYSADENNEIKRKYRAILNLYREKSEADKTAIEELGGLCVIGTECFDELRTEQQVRGRAGRQGAAGESYIFYSMEDGSIKKLFGPRYESQKRMIERLCEDESVSSTLLNKAIESGRLQIQRARFGGLKNLTGILYIKPSRKAVTDIIWKLFSNKITVWDAMEEYFASSESCIDELKEYKENGRIADCRLTGFLLPYIEEKLRKANKRQYGELIMQGIKDYLADKRENDAFEELFKIMIHRMLVKKWAEYIKVIEAAAVDAETVFTDKPKQKKKYLEKFSKARCEKMIENAFAEGIVMLSRSNID